MRPVLTAVSALFAIITMTCGQFAEQKGWWFAAALAFAVLAVYLVATDPMQDRSKRSS